MKRFSIKEIAAGFLAGLLSLFLVSGILAQTDDDGFVKRMIGKFKDEEAKVEESGAVMPMPMPKAAPAPVPEPEDLVDVGEAGGRTIADFTDKEIADRIKSVLERRFEIINFIGELKSVTDENGVSYLVYLDPEDGTTTKLSELPRQLLIRVLNRVNGEMNRLNNEAIMRQVQQIQQQAQMVNRISQQQAPKVYQPPPQPPRPPQPPPQPPKIYTPPQPPPRPPVNQTPPRAGGLPQGAPKR